VKKIKIYLTLSIILIGKIVNAQSYNNFYGDVVNNYSSDTIHKYLVEFENLGVKEHGTPALQNTLDWIIEKYNNYGYSDIEIDTFNYAAQDDYNLIVTKQGSLYPNTYVIIDGHYDTKSGTGTNDNGTGTAIIMEVARLLQTIDTEFSIKFIHFSGEEDGLIGSTHYVNNVVVPTNMDIKIVLNIDEVGGVNGLTNNTIVCERDQSNPSVANVASYAYTDTLANCMELYSNLLTEISYAYSSDYMPFQAQEKVITGLYEKNATTHAHTPTDFLINMDTNYVYEITQGTIGASLYFAVAHQFPIGINNDFELLNSTPTIYPNPAKSYLKIDLKYYPTKSNTIKISNVLGEVVLEKINVNTQEIISLTSLPAGVYILSIQSSNNYFSEKIIIQ
jgi:acetylornithine deacetylase/succinyl-diaminopimelate desuccinylase-like protein